MKKILYVTTISSTINAFLVPHINMLLNDGNIVHCACNIDIPISEELISMGVKVFNIPYQRTPFSVKNFKALKQLSEIQQKEQYDIIHVHTPVAAFYTRMLKIKFPNIKMIYTAHGFHFYKGAPLTNWLLFYLAEKVAANWTDTLITINQEDYNNGLKLGTKGNKVFKIHGVGVEEINIDKSKIYMRKELGISENSFVLTVIAELNKNKNHIQVIKALRGLKNEYKDIKVLFVGEGNLRAYLEKKINKYGLQDNIILLGFRDDVINIINASDVIGLCSKREGLPRSIMEAMICGKPIIATSIRGTSELVENGVNGILVEVNNYMDTARGIEELYINNELKVKLGEESHKKIEAFSITSVLKEIQAIYKV